jgi:hypothetical protein
LPGYGAKDAVAEVAEVADVAALERLDPLPVGALPYADAY